MYLLPGKIRPSLSRLRHDFTKCNLTEIRQWNDAEGSYPFENCQHTWDDQVLSERNPITVRSIALQTALAGLSRMVFCNCRDCDVGIIDEFRINNGTVPERFRQKRFSIDKIWMQSGLNRQKNSNEKFLQIIPAPQDTVQNTQNIVKILIRYSRICHDTGTIVIRLAKIGWISPNVTGRT